MRFLKILIFCFFLTKSTMISVYDSSSEFEFGFPGICFLTKDELLDKSIDYYFKEFVKHSERAYHDQEIGRCYTRNGKKNACELRVIPKGWNKDFLNKVMHELFLLGAAKYVGNLSNNFIALFDEMRISKIKEKKRMSDILKDYNILYDQSMTLMLFTYDGFSVDEDGYLNIKFWKTYNLYSETEKSIANIFRVKGHYKYEISSCGEFKHFIIRESSYEQHK